MIDSQTLSRYVKSSWDLQRDGHPEHMIRRRHRQGGCHQARAWAIHREFGHGMIYFPVQKHLARVIAYSRTLHNPVFTHYSAAAALSCEMLHVPHDVHVRGFEGSKQQGVIYRQDNVSQKSMTRTVRCGRDTLTVVDPITALIGCVRDAPIREGLVIVESALQRLGERLSYGRLHEALSEVKRVRGARKARYIADIMSPFIGIAGRNVGAFGVFRFGAQAGAAVRDSNASWGLSSGCGSRERAPSFWKDR